MFYRIFIFVLSLFILETPAFSSRPCPLISVSSMLAAGNYGALPNPENFNERKATEALKDKDNLLEVADNSAQTAVDQTAAIPPEKRSLYKRVKEYVAKKYQQAERRYGRRYAVLITGVFVVGEAALPIIPASGVVLAIPVIVVAEAHLLVRGRTPKQENQDNSGMKLFDLGDSMASEPSPTVQLSDAEIIALAKKLSWEIELFMRQESGLNRGG